MREIKFRGKRINNGEWVHGGIAFWENDTIYIINQNIVDQAVLWFNEVNPGTVGQYTGLKDKNGAEIFEGDIIKHHGDITSRVFYNSAHCAFMLDDITGNRNKCQVDHLGSYSSLWIEVIGNIYENPELSGGAG